jgi:hypothetical protein
MLSQTPFSGSKRHGSGASLATGDVSDRANHPRRAGWRGRTVGGSLPDRFDPQSVLHHATGGRIDKAAKPAVMRERVYRSETNESNYPYEFDRTRGVRDDVPVVSAQAAWSGPGRLAD